MRKIILENVEIAYYESGWGEKQLFLQPVYRFEGKSLSDNRKFHAYLPAVQPVYLEEKTLSKEDWQPSDSNIKENKAIHNHR